MEVDGMAPKGGFSEDQTTGELRFHDCFRETLYFQWAPEIQMHT